MVDGYRDLFEALPAPVLVTDVDGLVLEANRAAAALIAVPVSLLVGRPLQSFVDARDLRAFRLFVTGVPAGRSLHTELCLRRRSGVAIDVAINAVAHEGRLLWTLQDISPRRLVEKELWDLNRSLEEEVQRQSAEIVAVLEELPVGVIVVDAATRTILRANPRAQEIVSLEAGESVDAVETLDAHGRAIPPAERPSALALSGRRVDGARLLIRRKDGTTCEVEVSSSPLLDSGGAVTGAALTIEDVTLRARRDRAEREFVSNAAHQLRSPLTAITGALAVLGSPGGGDPATQARFLKHVERETERMVRLTHGLLTLASVERDELRPRPTVLAVRPLLDELAQDAAANGAELLVEAEPAVAVVANHELLVESLSNLVANAVRHGGGRVTLRGTRVAADVVLEVADEGPGMEPEVLERVFDRFYRADGALAGGFGLGLAIARAAARAAGGDLTIESTPGAGTTARVRLTGATLL